VLPVVVLHVAADSQPVCRIGSGLLYRRMAFVNAVMCDLVTELG
jgi:hypothetical protein